MAKVTRATMVRWVADLEETLDAKEEAIGNEEGKDNPNEDRITKLEDEAKILEDILVVVQEYIDLE